MPHFVLEYGFFCCRRKLVVYVYRRKPVFIQTHRAANTGGQGNPMQLMQLMQMLPMLRGMMNGGADISQLMKMIACFAADEATLAELKQFAAAL